MWQFILVHGVLFCGVSTALIYQLIVRINGVSEPSLNLVTSLLLFSCTGMVWGYFMWRQKELDRKAPKRTR